jgi:beta-1,4-mannosyl-glycoprotein beta-1,4-N-acetylglucosaminyltransferase
MIYDVLIFNNELDLLRLRLTYLQSKVDYFVVCESAQTFSNKTKPLYFAENRDLFGSFRDQIVYVEIPRVDFNNPWEVEFYQRAYFTKANIGIKDNDLVILSDVDEIPNIERVLAYWNESNAPALLETNMFYYGINLKMDQYCNRGGRPIIGQFAFFRNNDVGSRIKFRTKKLLPVLGTAQDPFAWHFSFMFGEKYGKYVEKIKSYSHVEYNTKRITDVGNIRRRIRLGVDILERPWVWGEYVDIEDEFPDSFKVALKSVGLYEYRLPRPSFSDYCSFAYLFILLKRLFYFLSLKWRSLKYNLGISR